MSRGTQRRLTAIVAADVVGFSRLMGVDETGTLAVLRNHRSEVIDPLADKHGGRIVKTTGDGLLLEFTSVVAAVEFSIATQENLAERNDGVPDDKVMRFRVGVHVGDVIIEGDDIFGDGVNIAARIEPLAKPGGVSLSDDAHRQVRDRLDVVWEDGGEHQAKNIARPIQIWHWQNKEQQSAEVAPPEDKPLEIPDKPSIAVLPFDNMSGDPEQEYFADGMTEDLITDLSKVSGLFVVARNSSFVFKGQPIDIQEVGRRLGVRYVVEGSVRKAGSRVRINVQLIDALNGGHIWAERYDGTVENVFELQDDVGAKVVEALSVRLRGDEKSRLEQVHTHNLDAYELYVRAKSTPYPPVPERIAAAREMFEQVIEMDPDFAGGYAGVSLMLALGATFGTTDPGETAPQALLLAQRAIEVDENFGWSYTALGQALLVLGRYEEAVDVIEEAITKQPNDADAHAYGGLILAFASHPDRGLEPIERAIRLNPQFINGPYLNMRGFIRFLAKDYEGAIRSLEENMERHGPVGPPVLSFAAMAYQALGDRDGAARAAQQLTTRFPAFRVEDCNLFKLIRNDEDRRQLNDLMHAAGLVN